MRVEKRVLNDALRVLGKVACQTSPVELYRSIRFVGDADGVRAMVTDGVETVSVKLDAFTEGEVDFGLAFKDIKDLLRASRSEVVELTGQHIEFPALDEPAVEGDISADAAAGRYFVDGAALRRITSERSTSSSTTLALSSSCFRVSAPSSSARINCSGKP